jgi:hypothetical protein
MVIHCREAYSMQDLPCVLDGGNRHGNVGSAWLGDLCVAISTDFVAYFFDFLP